MKMFIKRKLNGTQLHLCFASNSFTIPHTEGRNTPDHLSPSGINMQKKQRKNDVKNCVKLD